MQKPAPPKLPKPQPQHPHPKPLRRGDTAAPLPPPHAPLASGRPPSPHTPAPAFIRPLGPAPIGKALVEADELPAGSPESSCLGRHSSESPRQGRFALQGIWGARTSPSGGFSSYSESFTYSLRCSSAKPQSAAPALLATSTLRAPYFNKSRVFEISEILRAPYFSCALLMRAP